MKLIFSHHHPSYPEETHVKDVLAVEVEGDFSIKGNITNIYAKSYQMRVYVKDVPVRIDYDKHFNTYWLLDKYDAEYYTEPKALLPEYKESSTIWNSQWTMAEQQGLKVGV